MGICVRGAIACDGWTMWDVANLFVKHPTLCNMVDVIDAPRKDLLDTKQKKEDLSIFLFSTPSGARTLDPNIKSVVLYQLS